MRIIKPLRLSLLTRPYTYRKQHQLGVTVLAMATLDDIPMLVPEAEIWQRTSQWLEEDNVLDLAVPKPCAEFLVSGRAWSGEADEPGRVAVRVRVAGKEKTLLVFGDRRDEDGRWTTPGPVQGTPVDWRHAYGGLETDENPCGKGDLRDSDGIWHAANVESLEQRSARPGHAAQPASFGPVSPLRPRRFARAGKYDPAWIEDGFPGFLDTLDPHFFNAADQDQWLIDHQAFEPGAAYAIWNMHERTSCLQGSLPRWRARCFVARAGGDEETLDEVPLRHTTAWFFPDAERVLLMFQGSAPSLFDDASDIAAIMPAIELVDEPERSIDHYRRVLNQRQARETGPLHALKDSDLLPRAVLRDEDFFSTGALSQPLMINQQRRAERLREQMQDRIRQEGHDPADYGLDRPLPVEMSSLEDLPDVVRSVRRQGRLAQASLLRHRRDADRMRQEEGRAGAAKEAMDAAQSAPPGGPPRFNKSVQALGLVAMAEEAQAESGSDEGGPAGHAGRELSGASAGRQDGRDGGLGPDRLRAMLDEGQQGMDRLYLAGAHLQSPAPAAPGGRSVRMRRRVQALMQGSRDLSGLDLTGVDLSGLDMSGARCHHTWMEAARLHGASLAGADLSEAVLTRATLQGADLSGAVFSNTNMGGLSAEDASFEGASITGAILDQASFVRCRFDDASIGQCAPGELELVDCAFDRARLEAVNFQQQTRFVRVSFDRAVLHRVVWLQCELDHVGFGHAQLSACGWVMSDCVAVSFWHSHLVTCCAVQTDMAGASFANAWLEESSLRNIDMQGADFTGARLQCADLSESNLREASFRRADGGGSLLMQCDLTGADLRESDWFDAILSQSNFRFADLGAANLFRADVSQSRMDASTRMAGAYVKWTKTVPARVDEAKA